MKTSSRILILLFMMGFCLINNLIAQTIDPEINKEAPRIIPPPPNAAASTKFAGVDVLLIQGW